MTGLATLAGNNVPSRALLDRAKNIGRQIIAAVNDRDKIIAELDIDREFALPGNNWAPDAHNDYLQVYQMMSQLRDEDLLTLRLRCAPFTGNSLVNMAISRGLSSVATVPPNFEAAWPEPAKNRAIERWRWMAEGCPSSMVYRPENIAGEVGWLVDGVIVNPDTAAYQERLKIMVMNGVEPAERVLEIGGGYGALAAALCARQYVICDLPECLLMSGLYLSMLGMSVAVLTAEDDLRQQVDGEVLLLPNYLAAALADERFPLVINTLSLAEMSVPQIRGYAELISRVIGDDGQFFEQNHDNAQWQLEHRKLLAEFLGVQKMLALPANSDRGHATLWSNT